MAKQWFHESQEVAKILDRIGSRRRHDGITYWVIGLTSGFDVAVSPRRHFFHIGRPPAGKLMIWPVYRGFELLERLAEIYPEIGAKLAEPMEIECEE